MVLIDMEEEWLDILNKRGSLINEIMTKLNQTGWLLLDLCTESFMTAKVCRMLPEHQKSIGHKIIIVGQSFISCACENDSKEALWHRSGRFRKHRSGRRYTDVCSSDGLDQYTQEEASEVCIWWLAGISHISKPLLALPLKQMLIPNAV